MNPVARVAVSALLGLTVAVTGGCSTSAPVNNGTNFVSGDGTITMVPVSSRGAAVSVSGTTLEGAALRTDAWRGKIVVLNVWGSWCAPCRKEAPDLQAAYTELKAKDVQFLGINVSEPNKAAAQAFQRSFAITYPSLADDGGQALLSLHGAVSPKSIPSTVVLDPQGRIAARISSTVTRATLAAVVDEVRRTGGGSGAA